MCHNYYIHTKNNLQSPNVEGMPETSEILVSADNIFAEEGEALNAMLFLLLGIDPFCGDCSGCVVTELI